MRQMKADYGFEITETGDGHLFKYWKAPYRIRTMLAFVPVGFFLALILTLMLANCQGDAERVERKERIQKELRIMKPISEPGFLFYAPWAIGYFVIWGGLVCGPVVGAVVANRNRKAIPGSFLVGKTQLLVQDRSFPLKDISHFYIRDLTGEVEAAVSGQGGAFVVVGTGAVGTAMAVGSAATRALGQAGQAAGNFARRAYESVNIKIRFTFGEKDYDLAKGLDARRAEMMFLKLTEVLGAKS